MLQDGLSYRRAGRAVGISKTEVDDGMDLPWVDGGWPGSRHEHELIQLAGLAGALDGVEMASALDRGSAG